MLFLFQTFTDDVIFICSKIQKLKKLEANFHFDQFSNFLEFLPLKNLEELMLCHGGLRFVMENDTALEQCKESFHHLLRSKTNLKICRVETFDSKIFSLRPESFICDMDLKNLTFPCALEEIFTDFTIDSDL